jgi:hypothetical protein
MDVVIARNVLIRTAIIGEPHWHLGAAGDAAVAIGVALRIQKRSGDKLVLVDVTMTAVLCCALEGNDTAALLLSNSLERRANNDTLCSALSDSWLSHSAKTRCQDLSLHGRRTGTMASSFKDWRDSLLEAHPKLFGAPARATAFPECGGGWRDLLEVACTRIETALVGGDSIQVEQIKEKYGTLRFYWTGSGISESTKLQIEEAVALAFARSACTCEVCGRQGRLHSRKGWLSTSCAEHAKGEPVPVRRGLENLYIVRTWGSAGAAAARVSCRRYIRATDTFVDVDPKSLGITP